MQCRKMCGACCIAPSISKPFLAMPMGKPAGVRCVHLDDAMSCQIFGHPLRPQVCADFMPEPLFCGDNRIEAMQIMLRLEGISLEDSTDQ